MSQPLPLELNYRPTLPRRKDWRLGCVGAGFIMRDCHLVAYRNAGFNPVAIASRNPATARDVAAKHAIPVVHDTIEALLADKQVEILDVAVPPDTQPDLIRRAIDLGKGRLKGILAQKPLALSVRDALDLVKRCADAGIVFAVNQNMRFDQSVRAAKDVLTRGWLGDVVLATIDMRAVPHWMPWAEGLPSLSTFVMSIHHLDTFRYWLGTPIACSPARGPTRTTFPHRDGINPHPRIRQRCLARLSWTTSGPDRARKASPAMSDKWLEGTDGLMQGTIGWPKYPAREPSTLEFSTRKQPGFWFRPRWDDVWFPDAFVGTMAQLLVAVENGTEPEISARDNVETIALCEAVFSAANEHRVTSVREFLA